ncbi:MAG TPA: hypothetical protein VFJ82_15400 [Longimicrobium sp.]|nr:hypothetical protein [Longimicrobium sp.]
MRKLLVLFGALILCATPAAAQTSGPSAQAEPTAKMERAAPARTPSLYPTTDEVRAQVRANEEGRQAKSSAMTERDWLYLVAAIAVGVIIAAVVLN